MRWKNIIGLQLNNAKPNTSQNKNWTRKINTNFTKKAEKELPHK